LKPRITIYIRADGEFAVAMNEAGRDLLVKELQVLRPSWDHIHLYSFEDPEFDWGTDIPLSGIPYHNDDTVLEHGKLLLRPDDWDREYYPHVLDSTATETD
jgi:hypothetical protein